MNTPGDSAMRGTVRSLNQLEHVTEFGPFVQSALELSPRTTIMAGLRYDWVKFAVRDRLIVGTNPDDSGERSMRALSGSLGIAVNPSRSLTVYGNVGSSFETPTTTELANSPSGAGGFNTGLKPQHAWNFELGARGSLDDRFTYSVALFQAEVRDALIPYEIAAPGSSLGTREHATPGPGSGRRSVYRAWTQPGCRLDLLGLSVPRVLVHRHGRHPRAGRTATRRDSRQLAEPDHPRTARCVSGRLDGGAADLFVGIPGKRRREHAHVTVVVDERTRRMGR